MNMSTTMREIKGVSRDSRNEQSCNVTALYERLSRDDELTSESLSISNQKPTLRAMLGIRASPTVGTIRMMATAAAASTVPAGNSSLRISRQEL